MGPSNDDNQHPVYHNFLTERNVLLVFCGYNIIKSPKWKFILNLVYLVLIFCFTFYMQAMSLIAVWVNIGEVVYAIDSLHLFLQLMVCILGMIWKQIYSSQLEKTVQVLREGVYIYNGEPYDDEATKIKEEGVAEIRKISKAFSGLLVFSAISNTFFISLMQYLIIKGDTSKLPLNPYLPQPFYMPFDTRTSTGFVLGFLINLVFMIYLAVICMVMDELFCSGTIQLRDQFHILNMSLLKIEKRALQSCENLARLPMESLHKTKEYQDALYACLRRNVLHHQAILRAMELFEGYSGGSFLVVVGLASMILAARVILILENPEIHVMMNTLITLSAELAYTFHYCWYGEELTKQSSRLYFSLYNTPWMDCGPRFKKLLLITMINNKTPASIKTFAFNFSASRDSFGTIISTMYQMMNVVRNTNT